MRNVCWTLNNYQDGEPERLYKDPRFSYICFGFEVGANGTPHLQGYAELVKYTKFNTVTKIFNGRAHIGERNGTQEEAIIYCKKEGNFVERGEKKNQGARTDLDAVRSMALESGMRGISRRYNYQAIRVAERFLTYNEPARDWKPEVIWIWGNTGSGKSRLARELCSDDAYTKNTAHKWWDGYDGHEDIIIDDFRDSWWGLTYMLALLDRYEMQVEVKGGLRQIRAKRIIVTSLYPPEHMYRGVGEDIQQLLRRIDEVIKKVSEVSEVGGNTRAPTFTTEDYNEMDNWLRSINFEI